MTRGDGARHDVALSLTVPGRWAELALCAQADPAAWLPSNGQRGLAAIATRICGRCPGPHTVPGLGAIWRRHLSRHRDRHLGGTTPQERDRLRQQRKAAA